jgi:hypothetical protein
MIFAQVPVLPEGSYKLLDAVPDDPLQHVGKAVLGEGEARQLKIRT